MFELCVFGNSGYCQILHQDCWLMQLDLCLDLELSMGNYLRILVEVWYHYLVILSLSLDPVSRADTANTQSCNFSRDSLAFETDRDK